MHEGTETKMGYVVVACVVIVVEVVCQGHERIQP